VPLRAGSPAYCSSSLNCSGHHMSDVMMRTSFRLCICTLLLQRVACLSVNFMETDALRMEDLDEGMGPINQAAQAEFLPRLARPFNVDARASEPQREQVFHMDSKASRSNFQQLRKSTHKQEAANSTINKNELITHLAEHHHHISLPRIIAVVLVTLVGIGIAFMFMEEDDDKESARVHEGPPKPREELVSMESCDGTWAVTYQNAEAQHKQGLELLFRCHIIPTQEFAHAKVSQEHIDECVWIATHMLRQRSLEDWLNEWPQARDTFDDSVRKCYEERKDVRLERQNSAALKPPSGVAGNGKSMDEKKQATPAKGGTKASAPPTKQPLKIGDKKSLMDRCRQIMAASDAGRKPWSSTSSPEKKNDTSSPAKTATPPRVPNASTSDTAKASTEQASK